MQGKIVKCYENSEMWKLEKNQCCEVVGEYFENGESWYVLCDLGTGREFHSPTVFWKDTIMGRYLKDNNYYVGEMDEENNLIWVSIEGSDEFTEFQLHTNEQGEIFFIHDSQEVAVIPA